jgi:hypothetical protein
MYAIGAVPVALRAFVPEVALDLGLVTMAVGISWLAIWLFNRSSLITSWADQPFPTCANDPLRPSTADLS